jgi:hypothetical protein
MKIGEHISHQMRLTSLMCFFPKWTDKDYNQAFRNDTRVKIIKLLQQYSEGLTDSQMGKLIGCYPNLNINRPRRNDLSDEKGKYKIIIDSGKRLMNEQGNKETVWILNPERLYKYMLS